MLGGQGWCCRGSRAPSSALAVGGAVGRGRCCQRAPLPRRTGSGPVTLGVQCFSHLPAVLDADLPERAATATHRHVTSASTSLWVELFTCLLLLCCPGLSHCGRPRSGYSTHLAPGSGGLGAPATPCCISPAETHGTGSAEAGAAAGITQVWAPVTLLVGADQCDGEDAERCSSHCAVHSTGASCICPCPTGSPAGHHQLKELPAGLTNVPTGVAV